MEQFGTENYSRILDKVQNLNGFFQFFLSDFLGLNCANSLKTKIPQGTKCVNTSKMYATSYKSFVQPQLDYDDSRSSTMMVAPLDHHWCGGVTGGYRNLRSRVNRLHHVN